MSRKRSHPDRAVVLEEIRRDLAANFPLLHLFTDASGEAEVRGTFPVIGNGGQVLDSFQVSIRLPRGYPRDLPVTRETGGRIPWLSDRHIDHNGDACVLLPDERWRIFPVGKPFLHYLTGALHSFFLSQLAFEAGMKWPFGEWGHGPNGIIEHYRELLKTKDLATIARYLDVLRRPKLELLRECPCGSGKKIGRCCRTKLYEMRRNINPKTAQRSFEYVEACIQQSRALSLTFRMRGAGLTLLNVAGTMKRVA